MEQRFWRKPMKTLPWYILGFVVMGGTALGYAGGFDAHLAGREISGALGLAGTALLTILAIIAHILGKKHGAWWYILSYGLNLAAAGFSAGTYYACAGIVPTVTDLLSGGLWGLIPGVIVCVGLLYPKKRWQSWWLLLSLLAALSLLGYGIFCWTRNPVVGSSQTFSVCVFLFFLIPCAGKRVSVKGNDPAVEMLSFGGFGALGIITLIVVIVITEGEILEGVLEGIGEFFAELFGDLFSGSIRSKRGR